LQLTFGIAEDVLEALVVASERNAMVGTQEKDWRNPNGLEKA
jgi:hypothetical protein